MSTPVPIRAEHAASDAAARLPALEWPTLALLIADYAAWLALTKMYGDWPLWLIVPGVALLLTLHSSLQHEVLHGHPTRSAVVNRLQWCGGAIADRAVIRARRSVRVPVPTSVRAWAATSAERFTWWRLAYSVWRTRRELARPGLQSPIVPVTRYRTRSPIVTAWSPIRS